MTQAARIRDFEKFVGAEVEVRGWLYNRRGSGKVQFLILRDGSGICQAVAGKQDVPEEKFEEIRRLTQETSLTVTGIVKREDRAPGGYEMTVKDVTVVTPAEPDYPIGKQEHGTDFLLQNRHLWLRSRKQVAIMQVRHVIVKAIRDFFDERGFTLVDAPIFTPSSCEGTTTLFPVDYFEDKMYLTQSGQLYMEAAAMALGKAYCFGPTFRAEKSKTRRHLTEFWMVEPEMAYAGIDDVMDLAEDFVHFIVTRALEQCAPQFRELERDTAPLEKIVKPFPRVSYTQAVEILAEKGHEFKWGDDFGAPDETVISEKFDRPVLIHRYPRAVKAFYMKADPADDRLALCVDMIAPEGVGEIIGGGQRAESLGYLEEQIAKHKLPEDAFRWYLDLRRYGSVPHGGFGLGLERTVGWIAGVPHVRECIPFPRTIYRVYP